MDIFYNVIFLDVIEKRQETLSVLVNLLLKLLLFMLIIASFQYPMWD